MAVSALTNSEMPMPAFKIVPSPFLTFHLYKQPLFTIDIEIASPDTSYSPLSISSPPSMRLPFLAALLGLLTTSLAHNIQMGAHQRECFHEVLHKDDKMTVTFQVGDREFGGAGNLEIDFWIVGPTNEYLINQKAVSSGDHSFDARNDGKHVYCFSNEAWSASTKEVSFNVHGIVYVPESEAPSDPLEAEVKQLTELLNQVKDEQSYIVIRERTHRNTAESTNGRVKWWSIFQLGVLIGEGIFQVWWLKRFFEVKRVV